MEPSPRLPSREQCYHDRDYHHDYTDTDLERGRSGTPEQGAPAGPHRSAGTPLVGVLREGRSDKGPDEAADDRTDEQHRYAYDGTDDSADERAPAGSLRTAISLSKAEADPRLEHLAEKREADLQGQEPEAIRMKIRVPAIAENREENHPEAGKAERDENQSDQADQDEQQEGEGFAHALGMRLLSQGHGHQLTFSGTVVQIDRDDLLPGSQDEAAPEDWDREAGFEKSAADMGESVAVAPTCVMGIVTFGRRN